MTVRSNPTFVPPVMEPIPIPDGLIELMGLEEECKKQVSYLERQGGQFMRQYKYAMKNGRSVQAMENLKLYKVNQIELTMFKEALEKIDKKLQTKIERCAGKQ